MNPDNRSLDKLMLDLQERAKELNCLYHIEEILSDPALSLEEAFEKIIQAIPPGWQYPDICQARVIFDGDVYYANMFPETPWSQESRIMIQNMALGRIQVFYTEEMPSLDEGPFLKEERKLLDTIAERVSHYIFHRNLKQKFDDWQHAREELSKGEKDDWRVILELLRSTDRQLFIRIARKMGNHLIWSGVDEAKKMIQDIGQEGPADDQLQSDDMNRPRQKQTLDHILQEGQKTFQLAARHIGNREIVNLIQRWIQEDKSLFLLQTLEQQSSSLADIADALTKYTHMVPDPHELPDSVRNGVMVSLIRRFFTEQLEYIQIAKNYITVKDFHDLLKRMIMLPTSHGKLGGKSAGLYLASKILQRDSDFDGDLDKFRLPKTWHITSDVLVQFLHYNNLEDIIEQKYKPIDQIRLEYPHIEQVFKNAYFPPEIVRGLTSALDDFGPVPLIIRSSSLLEDRMGSAFSGKYKSLFVANQGSIQQRLEALLDAIAEVYASTFGPDPIEYRVERGLLDFNEEMGIMIQEVVGTKVNHYFFPAFAGVAFSNNEFRWSPRIKREDGLLRLVPGLGTRAVDRLSDDYPVLIAPGQPGLRVNVVPEEVVRYSPRKIDVINLESNSFETMDIDTLFRECGHDYPRLNHLVSIVRDSGLFRPIGLQFEPGIDDLVVTFDGLIANTAFVQQVRSILKFLELKLGTPVDIEFASDGTNFFLLQCRPQSYSAGNVPVPIPRDLERDQIVFTANRFVSNGIMPEITHIVYVDPEAYNELTTIADLTGVGKAVGMLNKLLPKRQFILMGPGRWGSRGDIKLGVRVTYSDINNTAMLIEVARKKGNYVPDLSFGTHFFQDLVESSIRYLPLYPDDGENRFNISFLKESPNILARILPEFESLAAVVHVIDIPQATDGQIVRIVMNADAERAVAYISPPLGREDFHDEQIPPTALVSRDHWRWRQRMAHELAAQLDSDRLGVQDIYLFGSTQNATAGPGSDIDLLVHFHGDDHQLRELNAWLEGWSLCLAEMNYLRTGYRYEGLLDVHIITDDDIRRQTSYAIKINAVTDPAVRLPLKKRRPE